MASFFVACDPQADGAHAVHDRSLCPPRCFPRENAAEYLGEFLDGSQALAVARLRYARAQGCACAIVVPARATEPVPALLPAVSALRT
jgi:hypothetical protein